MKRCILLFLVTVFLCSCAGGGDVSFVEPLPSETEESMEVSEESEYIYEYLPAGDRVMNGVWISQYDITDVWCNDEGQTPESEFILHIDSICKNISADGYTAIFVQLRPFGDSFYPSAFYPPSEYAVGAYGNAFDYDALELFISAAHRYGLEFHGWINPFRLMEKDDVALLPDDSIIKAHIENGDFTLFNGRYYIRPSDDKGKQLILNGISEIIQNYEVDGIHFDDYFYPTKDPSFDEADFASSGAKELYEWRRTNVSEFVKEVYSLVKQADKECVFGISPSGNMDYTYNTCCTDIYKWCSQTGYIDYIMPQIYFGFKHPDAPFSQTLTKWQNIIKIPDVRLYVGLAAYKQGTEDLNAGIAKDEWITDTDMLFRQADECTQRTDGFVMFSYSYIY